jgi:two-component system, OmpR family, alkaline phosphatase synthesis response regulator PhoP
MEPKRVLIIDDEEAIQVVVKIGLQMAVGWTVVTASSGPEGILAAQTNQPDIILLDMMMPEMDGLTTFRTLQQGTATQAIPVIFLTASAQIMERHLFYDTGARGVILKPFNSFDLADQICKVLNW